MISFHPLYQNVLCVVDTKQMNDNSYSNQYGLANKLRQSPT